MVQFSTVLIGLETGLLKGLDSLKWMVEALQEHAELVALSTVIQGFSQAGNTCLQVVVKANASMQPEEVVQKLRGIERAYKENTEFMEPMRCFLLAYDQKVSMTPQLLLPHPQLVSNSGWLYCCWEVWRNYRHPVLDITLEKLLAEKQMTNVQFFSQSKAIISKSLI